MASYRNKRINLAPLLSELRRTKAALPGQHTLEDFLILEQTASVVHTCLECDPQVPEREKLRIVYDALTQATAADNLTVAGVLAAASRLESAFLGAPHREYKLVTGLSIVPPPRQLHRSISGVNLSIYRRLPSDISQARASLKGGASRLPPQPSGYVWIVARTAGRSPHEAGHRALTAINQFRGVLNYLLDFGSFVRIFGGRPTPLNRARLGPLHTLHRQDGSLVESPMWYDPFFLPSEPPHDPGRRWPALMKNQRRVYRRLKSLSYGDTLAASFADFANALDSNNYELCIVKLWALLEQLTDTGWDRAQETVRRAVFLFGDRDMALAVLEHVRDQRNAIAHSGPATEDLDGPLLQLRRFVQSLFAFHLHKGLRFRSLGQAGEYLSITPDIPALKTRLADFSSALRFQQRQQA